jgi:hypothetical protein
MNLDHPVVVVTPALDRKTGFIFCFCEFVSSRPGSLCRLSCVVAPDRDHFVRRGFLAGGDHLAKLSKVVQVG